MPNYKELYDFVVTTREKTKKMPTASIKNLRLIYEQYQPMFKSLAKELDFKKIKNSQDASIYRKRDLFYELANEFGKTNIELTEKISVIMLILVNQDNDVATEYFIDQDTGSGLEIIAQANRQKPADKQWPLEHIVLFGFPQFSDMQNLPKGATEELTDAELQAAEAKFKRAVLNTLALLS